VKDKLFIILLSAFCFQLFAQHDIKIDLEGYQNDTLIVGYYLGDKQLVHDTLFSQSEGKFRLQGDSTLTHGFYILLTIPDNRFIQFIVDEDQKFEIKSIKDDLSVLKFKGSEDNELFMEYIDFLSEKRPIADTLRAQISKLVEGDPERTKLQKELDLVDKQVKLKKESIIKEHPKSLTAMILKSSENIDIPDFEGTEDEVKTKTYLYYKKHYFDHIDLSDPTTLRTPFIDQRVKYYMKNLTPNQPDSIIRSMEYILDQVKPAEETFRFYLSTFLNEYIQSKIVGMDKVYVYLAENYYAKGMAPWLDEETTNKIVANAMDIKPVLIGETGANITVYREDGTPISIDDIDYEYLVLLFWAPDCGHCKKVMPSIIEFYNNYKDKGVKLLAICSKLGDKADTCWPAIEEKGMSGFINAADKYNKSKSKVKYNVKTTPKIFILDKNREILIKNIGGDQLAEVMEEMFKRAERKKMTNEH